MSNDWWKNYTIWETKDSDPSYLLMRPATEADQDLILEHVREEWKPFLEAMEPSFHALVDQFASFTVSGLLVDDFQPPDPKQRARARSKADVRRKRRGGKYKWGGQADENNNSAR